MQNVIVIMITTFQNLSDHTMLARVPTFDELDSAQL
jgi:hypothetical protein